MEPPTTAALAGLTVALRMPAPHTPDGRGEGAPEWGVASVIASALPRNVDAGGGVAAGLAGGTPLATRAADGVWGPLAGPEGEALRATAAVWVNRVPSTGTAIMTKHEIHAPISTRNIEQGLLHVTCAVRPSRRRGSQGRRSGPGAWRSP